MLVGSGIVLLITLAAGSDHPSTCAGGFSEVLDQHLSAIRSRDLDGYMATVAAEPGPLVILPDGSVWRNRQEIEQGHREWFADTTWQFDTTLVHSTSNAHWGVVVYEVAVNRPQKPGKPFLLSMMFAPQADGCWALQHDQNTPLP